MFGQKIKIEKENGRFVVYRPNQFDTKLWFRIDSRATLASAKVLAKKLYPCADVISNQKDSHHAIP